MAVRILIADDDTNIRRLFRRLLEGHPGWEVCGEAVDGRDAVNKALNLAPDVCLLDLAMPGLNGLQAAREIFDAKVPTRMLLLTVQQISQQLAAAASAVGFLGAISKCTGAEVIEGVELLLGDQTYFCVEKREIPRFITSI